MYEDFDRRAFLKVGSLSLFGFIIWIGLAISWLFFHGVHPPLITGGG